MFDSRAFVLGLTCLHWALQPMKPSSFFTFRGYIVSNRQKFTPPKSRQPPTFSLAGEWLEPGFTVIIQNLILIPNTIRYYTAMCDNNGNFSIVLYSNIECHAPFVEVSASRLEGSSSTPGRVGAREGNAAGAAGWSGIMPCLKALGLRTRLKWGLGLFEFVGVVNSITWRRTRVRTRQGPYVQYPGDPTTRNRCWEFT